MVRPDVGTDQEDHPNKQRWGLIFFLFLLLSSIACLALLLFTQGGNRSLAREFVPVSLHSQVQADYLADPNVTRVPGVRLDIIWDTIFDREPGVSDLEERQTALQNSLLTPVPTVTPSMSTCEGLHFFYADQDTWLDSTNPTVTHGTEPFLRLGRDGNNVKRVLLHFSINDSIPQNTRIYSARLEMDVEQTVGLSPSTGLNFYNLDTSFGEVNTNWSNQPQPIRQYQAGELTGDTIHVWDITGLVQDWLAGRSQNQGIVLEPGPGADFTVIYYSREVVSQGDRLPNGFAAPVGPRMVINCGGDLPDAISVNLNTPTPTPTGNPPTQQPAKREATATPQPTVPVPTATPLLPPTTVAPGLPPDPTDTPEPSPPPDPPPPTDTPTPPPPDDDDGGGGGEGPPPPPPANADLALNVNDSPDPVIAGDNLTYSFNIVNNGPNNASNVIFSDTLPPGVSLVSATASQGTGCSGTTNISCNLGSVVESSGATVTIVVTVNSGATGNLTNTAGVSSAASDPAPANNSSVETTAVTTQADLKITKTGSSDPVIAGSVLTYTLTAKNAGPSDVVGVAITDTLPANVTFNSASSGCALSGGTVLCNGGTLTAGSSSAFTIAVIIDPTLADGTLISNTASISSSEPDPTLGDNSATEPTTVNRMADLTLTKSDTPDPVVAGQSLTYTLSITNNGPSEATGVIITDTLPAGVTYVSAAGCTPSGGKVICTIPGKLLPGSGAQKTIVVDVGSSATGFLTNQAVVGGTEADTAPGNNTASITTTVNAVADLSLNKLVGNATPNVGSAVLFTVTVSNAGPSDATGVTVSDPLPSGYSFVSAAASLGSYGGGLWNIGTISATTGVTLTITATVNASGVYTNYAQVQGADAADPNSTPGDNSTTDDDDATVTVNPIPVADLSIAKIDTPDPVVAGQILTYTLTVVNNGPSDAQNLVVTDMLPLKVSVTNVDPVTATQTGQKLVWNFASLASGSTQPVTVVVRVDSAALGSLTNSAVVTSATQDLLPVNNATSITTTVQVEADLAASKAASDNPVIAGQSLTYTLSITNNGPSDATGVAITDTLSSVVTFASATGCAKTGSLVSCNIGGLAAGSSVQQTVVVTVNASTTEPFSNTVIVGGNETDPNTGNNTDTITTTVSTSADLAVTKSDTPDPVVAGQTLTYTVSITNNGPSDASGVVVTDVLPGGVAFSSAAGCSESGGVVTCSIGALAAGSSLQRTLVVTVNAATTGILTNQVDVTGFVVDPVAANNSDTITTTVTTSADLQISKSDSPDPVTAGTVLTYTLTITNNGPSVAQNVVVTDTLPLSVTVLGTSPAFSSQSGQDWGWTLGSMPQGAVQTIVISVTVDSARTGVLINTGVITGSTPDPNTGNNSATVFTNVGTQTDLSVTKAASSILAYAGQPLTYTLTITNSGPSDATGVIIADTLSGAVDFGSAPGCNNAGSLVTCSVADLASGNSVQRTVVVTVNLLSAAPITNTVTVSGNETDPDISNNSHTITTPRNPYADLAISKRDSSDPVTVGSLLTYTLSITNNGPFDATNLTITDTLPASVTFNSASPGCAESGGIVTCSVASLTAGANQQITIAVDVISTTAGLMTNTAEVLADTDDPNLGDNVATESTTIVPTVSINDVTVTEGDSGSTTATFSVSLSTVSSLTATVAYVTGDNTATVADGDYNATGGTLTFSPGTTVQTFTVTINGDTVDEPDEIYFINLSSPTNAAILDGLGVGAIIDDDNPSLSINDVSITEGDSGSVSAVFTVTLSAVGVQTATVDYATANGTATADSDYTGSGGSLTFAPGVTQQTITITIASDLLSESDETFFVNLSNPGEATLADGQGVGTIIDDDPASACGAPATTLTAVADSDIDSNQPTSNFGSVSDLQTKPASSTPKNALIKFDLSAIPSNNTIVCSALLLHQISSANTGQNINVHRVTTDWTELNVTWNDRTTGTPWTTAGGDFDSTVSATFVPSTTSHVVNLTSVAQFWYANPGANFGLLLRAIDVGNNANLSFASRENGTNPPPQLVVEYIPNLSINDVTVTEGNSGATTATFTVTLSSSSAQTVTVDYATSDNTATTANNDYVGKTGALTLLPGVTQQTISVTVNGDTNHEANETFLINLSNPTNAGISDGQGVGAIINDELGGTLLGPGSGQIFLPLIIKSEPLVLEVVPSSINATE